MKQSEKDSTRAIIMGLLFWQNPHTPLEDKIEWGRLQINRAIQKAEQKAYKECKKIALKFWDKDFLVQTSTIVTEIQSAADKARR